MTDNARYCVFARFCHPCGDAWTLTERSDAPEARQMAIREASMCPSGRLMAWDRTTGKPFEFRFAPSLGLIEDPAIGSSGGLWVRGGIPVRREDGRTYEIRNRTVLCRCGKSANKPLLRRHARSRQMARRPRGRTGRGAAARKRSADAAEPGVRSRRTQPGHDRSGKGIRPCRKQCGRGESVRTVRRREHPAARRAVTSRPGRNSFGRRATDGAARSPNIRPCGPRTREEVVTDTLPEQLSCNATFTP